MKGLPQNITVLPSPLRRPILFKFGGHSGALPTGPYDFASIYAALGDEEQAVQELERAYEDRSGWWAWWLKVDPLFERLRMVVLMPCYGVLVIRREATGWALAWRSTAGLLPR